MSKIQLKYEHIHSENNFKRQISKEKRKIIEKYKYNTKSKTKYSTRFVEIYI